MSLGRFGRLVHAELFKIWRGRLGRAALLITMLATGFPVAIIALIGDQRVTTFPAAVPELMLPTLTFTSGIVGVLLAASGWGDEYSQGTIRTILYRCPARWQFLLVKTAALALANLVIVLLGVTFQVFVVALSHLIQLGAHGLGEHLLAVARIGLPLVGVWWLGSMVYVSLVLVTVVALQSGALGMACGLGLYVADFVTSSLGLGSSTSGIGDYMVVDNSFGMLNAIIGDRLLTGGSAILTGMVAQGVPRPMQALFRLLFIVAAALLLAGWLFERRDIAQ